jgi:hypothetical protein
VDVESALLIHTPAYVQIFLNQWDKSEFETLWNNKLTVVVLGEIMDARYGRGNNTKALINFVWRRDAPTEISCVGSLALLQHMQRSGHIKSIEALSLFLHVNKHRKCYTEEFSRLKSCRRVQEYAPDMLKRFLNQDESCKCCLASTIDYLDSILAVNSADLPEKYPREVLFIVYVLYSLKTANQSEEFQHEILTRETNFQATYEAALNSLVSYTTSLMMTQHYI